MRRDRARLAAELRDYKAWKAGARPARVWEQAREQARERVAAAAPAIRARFARDWGLDLPDTLLRFWA